jgi:hypothetical protein
MTNGLVEIGLMSASVLLGFVQMPVWALGMMIMTALVWWSFVHHRRWLGMVQTAPTKALGAFMVAILLTTFGHGVGFFLGGASAQILGVT